MAEIFKQLHSLHFVHYVGVDDFADKLSFLLTPALLMVACSVVTVRTYVMQPLACYLPNPMENSRAGQESFVNNFCWTEGTFAVNAVEFTINGTSPDGGMARYEGSRIVYYQWVPFVLGVQALLCYLPRVFWHLVSFDKAGTDLGRIVKIADDAVQKEEETREKLVTHVSRLVRRLLRRPRSKQLQLQQQHEEMDEQHQQQQELLPQRRRWLKAAGSRTKRLFAFLLPSKLFGSSLIVTYFFIKVLYFANTLLQLAMMQMFLQLEMGKYRLFGLQLLYDILCGRDWRSTMAFPRVGCCAVFLRTSAKGSWIFAQCSLPVNMINEKLYVFLWFWFLFLLLMTAASLVKWVCRVGNKMLLPRFVKNYLKLADNYSELRSHKEQVKEFVKNYVGRDGAFLLQMISLNSGDLICSEIIQNLWREFKAQQAAGASPTAAEAAEAAAACRQPVECGVLGFSCANLPAVPVRKSKSVAAFRRHRHSDFAGVAEARRAERREKLQC